MRCRGVEEGSVTTELVLVTPVLLLLLAFVVLAGRVGGVQQQVIAAADEAARAASLRATAGAGQVAAVEVAEGNLADAGVSCRDVGVGVDTSAFGRGGHVGVTVTCAVGLDDVAFVGLPGQRRFTATSTEVIDRFRGGA